MAMSSFYKELRIERETRRLQTEEALSATPEVPKVDAVPLDASFVHSVVPHADPGEATAQSMPQPIPPTPLGSKHAADDTALTSEQFSQIRRELELSRMRESELRLEVQQLVARNRELELQLKVYKVIPPALRGAEAEGSHRQARWCAPGFRMAGAGHAA